MKKRLLLIFVMMLALFSCGAKEEKTETAEDVAAATQELDKVAKLYEELNLELTNDYKDKGIKEVSVAAYAKGMEAILIKDEKAEIKEEDFKTFAEDIAKRAKEKLDLPEAVISVLLEDRSGAEPKTIYEVKY